MGGLGNQLFQYAFCKFLKSKGFDASLDGTSYLSTGIANDYLDVICSDINVKKGVKNSNNGTDKSYTHKLIRFVARIFYNSKIIYETKFLDHKNTENRDIFYGYWQENKYLQNIDLKINLNPRSINKKYIINSENDLAIHIRLGDYLKKKNQSIYARLGKEYYSEAIEYFVVNRNISRIFLFSNTPSLAKEMIEHILIDMKATNMELILVNDEEIDDFEEMYLMSLANNIIIANSTFSFWAAYLGSKEKHVVAPVNWYYNAQVNEQKASLIVQENWIYL